MTIRNNLPVDVTGTAPVKLVDSQGSVQAFFDFTNVSIPAGRSQTVYDSLEDRTLGNGTSVSGLSFSTPGSGVPVPIPPDSMLVATIFVSGLRVSDAQIVRAARATPDGQRQGQHQYCRFDDHSGSPCKERPARDRVQEQDRSGRRVEVQGLRALAYRRRPDGAV